MKCCFTLVPISDLGRVQIPLANSASVGQTVILPGNQQQLYQFLVSVWLGTHHKSVVTVYGWDGELIIIGRDLLNQHFIALDGPNLTFTM
jgi:hypothetical protein